ncbi:MAG: DUF2752 domain-containing protein [Saccharofermentanales bacterium]|jgi:hypothetical protein
MPEPQDRNTWKKHRWLGVVLVLVFISFLLEMFGSGCFFASVIGIPCAGCGSTRAVLYLLQGNVKDALRMHPLIFLTLILLVAVPIVAFLKWLGKRKGKALLPTLSPRWYETCLIVIAATYLITYVVRMILYFPHTEPMTYNTHSLWGRIYAFFRAMWTR